ncbi:MAG: hypothetical protein HY075_03050, partial [Deltaproteobacteria bacterium]|nr:hypothetical protein [Deltaproteobacteria bacterium]
RLLDDVAKDNPQKAQEAQAKLNNAVNTKLKRLGYNEIGSYTKTNIGDVKLVGKYQLYKEAQDSLAVKGELTLPTGVAPNVDNALDTPTGDGQVDIGATIIADHYLDRQHAWRTNAYAGYTVQLPDHLDRRLPVNENDSLSNDKELLARKLGDIVQAGTSIQYEFPFGLNLGTAYAVQRLGKTSYGDGSFQSFRYRLLEANTGQTLHSATFGVGFSTVEMYKRKEFKAPFQVNWAYCMPIAGVNTVKNDYMSFELVMFF